MDAYSQGFFDKCAQEGLTPDEAKMLADLMADRLARKQKAKEEPGVLGTIGNSVVGAGKGLAAGSVLAGLASMLHRYTNHLPVTSNAAIEQALEAARIGAVPGAFIGGVMGVNR